MNFNRMERLAHKLLQASLSLQDALDQGCPVSEDAMDLHNRAEDVVHHCALKMISGAVVETRRSVVRG